MSKELTNTAREFFSKVPEATVEEGRGYVARRTTKNRAFLT